MYKAQKKACTVARSRLGYFGRFYVLKGVVFACLDDCFLVDNN